MEAALLNHGHLIQPPIDIGTNGPLGAFEQIALAPGEWAVIYLSAGTCLPECKLVLERLSTIRGLLGHAGGRLTVAVLVDDQAVDLPRVRSIVDGQARTHVEGILASRIVGAHLPAIVILDWRKQMMMYFPGDAASSGIKADLKRLLRASTLR
jgi:hypothetical protein